MKRKSKIKYHIIISAIFSIICLTLLILFGYKDEYLEQTNNRIYMVLFVISFLYLCTAVIIFGLKRNNRFVDYLKENNLYQKPVVETKKIFKKILLNLLPIPLIFGIMLAFYLGNNLVQLFSVIIFILSVLAACIAPIINKYRQNKKLENEEDNIDLAESYNYQRPLPENKKYLLVRSFGLGRVYFCVKAFNSYYFIRFNENIDINNLVISEELLNDKKNFKINGDEVSFFSCGKANNPNLQNVISVTIKAPDKKITFYPFQSIYEEIDLFFTDLKRFSKVIDNQEKQLKEEINFSIKDIDNKRYNRISFFILIIKILSILFSVLLFFFVINYRVMFISLSIFYFLGLILLLIFNKYFTIIEMPNKLLKKEKDYKAKIGIGSIMMPPIFSLASRALYDFKLIELNTFFLYSLYAFLVLTIISLPFWKQLFKIKVILIGLLLNFALYSPLFIAYSNVSFYRSKTETEAVVISKYTTSGESITYTLVVDYTEKERKFNVSEDFYKNTNDGDTVIIIDIIGLYRIHQLFIDESAK